MSVEIPNPMTINLGQSGKPFEAEAGVTVGGTSTPVGVNITHLPKILIGIDKLQIGLDKVQVGLDKIQIGLDKVQVGIDPLTLNLAIKEIPSIRAHLPAAFSVGFSALGVKLFSIDLCGKAQVITEPFVPNRAERCGAANLRPANPAPGTLVPGADLTRFERSK